MDALTPVTGLPEFKPEYWYLAFFSEGFRICLEGVLELTAISKCILTTFYVSTGVGTKPNSWVWGPHVSI